MNELPYLAALALRHEWAGREHPRAHAAAVEARLTARARASERAARRRAHLRAGLEGLLGMKITAVSGDWLDLEPLGGNGPCLSFQRVPEGKTGKNRIHLDLGVPDIGAAGKRAASLGATPAAGPMGDPGAPFRVWRDPEGNEFCFCTES
ncbi:MAG: hypothetical protein FWJ90_12370 [Actinomadura sp.]